MNNLLSRLIPIVISVMLALPGCSKNNDDWSNIDYEKIARDNERRENDSGYVAPPRVSVVGCVDDDLYNCNPKTPHY